MIQKKNIQRFKVIALSFCLLILVSGCSDDAPQQVNKVHDPFDHSHDEVVTDIEKHKFEHDFAEQCIAREISQSINKDNDRKRFTKPCMCIAKYMLKDLTAVEADKFLKEKKGTQSLRIRYDNAAYHCLQEKSKPKAIRVFNAR